MEQRKLTYEPREFQGSNELIKSRILWKRENQPMNQDTNEHIKSSILFRKNWPMIQGNFKAISSQRK